MAGVISDDARGATDASDDLVEVVCCEKDSVEVNEGSVWVLEFGVKFAVEEAVALSVGRKPSATIMASRS
jgi:hypothetical protein